MRKLYLAKNAVLRCAKAMCATQNERILQVCSLQTFCGQGGNLVIRSKGRKGGTVVPPRDFHCRTTVRRWYLGRSPPFPFGGVRAHALARSRTRAIAAERVLQKVSLLIKK